VPLATTESASYVQKESTMRFSVTFVWFFVLVTSSLPAFSQNDDVEVSRQLPDQYAETVLQVEGMI